MRRILIPLTVGMGILLASAAAARGQPVATATAPAPAKPDVNITERGLITLHVQGADLRSLLQLLSNSSKTNIIATKEVQGKVTASLYDVTFTEALDAVLKSAGFVYTRKGNFIHVMTPKQAEDIAAAQRAMTVTVFRLNYITAKDAQALIVPAMSKEGTVSVTPEALKSVAPSSEETGGNDLASDDVLVVKDYPENLEKVTAILREVDVRPQQVIIEATILRATLDERNALGIDFDAFSGVDFRTMGSASTDLSTITHTGLPAANFDQTTGRFRTDLRGGVPAGGLSIGLISNKIAFFVRALEQVTDVAVLANPKLLIMNKQRGEVLVGNRSGYLTTNVTETSTTQTVEFLETGTKLVVRPYISSDGYVRLEIHPEDSDGSVDANGLPSEETTECTSNVLIKDGHTIVIGGLFRERTSNSRAQVPGLGNLPIVGNLFRRRNEQTDREEIIILITPHIIKHAADEIVSQMYRDEIDRIRFGARQGLMWYGRDRLAQGHMRRARRHIDARRYRFALWNVNLALSLQPRLLEGLRIKERLTNRAIWAREARVGGAMDIIQHMMMRELGQPLERVVPPGKPRNAEGLDKAIRDALGTEPRLELPLRKTPDKATKKPTPEAKAKD